MDVIEATALVLGVALVVFTGIYALISKAIQKKARRKELKGLEQEYHDFDSNY